MDQNYSREYIEELCYKLKAGTITPAERRTFDQWYQMQADKELQLPEGYAADIEEIRSRIYQQIQSRMDGEMKIEQARIFPLWKRIAVAASILLVVAIGYIWLSGDNSLLQTEQALVEDFAPGSNTAVLTLADGRQLQLKGKANNSLTTQGAVVIEEKDGGQLVYNGQGQQEMMNSVATPKGGQYRLILSDGTAVWLNAASSISYPVTFADNERMVETTGEVYFEVAHRPSAPFRVKSKGQNIEVLGTHFNVNAYPDENGTVTTLLQGSVKIASTKSSAVLRPGQAALVEAGNIKLVEVDVNTVTAWKDGYFEFVDADVRTIMRQLARWYNLEVEFGDNLTTEKFTGRISRNRNISQVLSIIQQSNSVNLNYNGRRIIVK